MGEFKNISEIGRTVIKVERPQEEEDRDRYGNSRVIVKTIPGKPD